MLLLPENCFLDASGTEQHWGREINFSLSVCLSVCLSLSLSHTHTHTHTHTETPPFFFLPKAEVLPISGNSSKFQMSHFPKSLLSVLPLNVNFLCAENKNKTQDLKLMGFGWLLKTTPFHLWWLLGIVFKTLCPSTTKMSWGWGQRRDSDWLWILRALVRTPIHICVFTSKGCDVCIVARSCPTLCDACHPPGSSVHRDSPGKNNGVGCHALLQGIFPTQGSNPGLLHCKWIFYQLGYQESPRATKSIIIPISHNNSVGRYYHYCHFIDIATEA